MTVCIRGATTAQNTRDDILLSTKELLEYIMDSNEVEKENIISIIFTATKDLDKVYPAVAARELGITEGALMCVQEMYVEGSMLKCIRVAITVESGKKQSHVKHIYLKGAKVLRPDITTQEER